MSATRPDIVIILADDLGFSDVGCFGGEIETPNIDALAREGVRFTSFASSARCCPTRAALLTGCHPHQAGVGHMTSQTPEERERYAALGLEAYRGMLGPECVTLAEVLRAAGYQTLMSGKWHVGQWRPQWPVDRGFERYYGLISGGCNYFSPEPKRLFVDQDLRVTEFPDGFYTTDAFSERAVRFVEEAEAGRPLFLYLAYTAPHWPLHAWPEDIERYRGRYRRGWDELRHERFARQRDMRLLDGCRGPSARDPECPPWDEVGDHERWDLRMATYAAQVHRMDRGIGTVLEALRRRGRRENAAVMFLSDNGACAETIGARDTAPIGTRASFTSCMLPWANASNTPFRLFKHWTHEGGIASPFVFSWPAALGGRAGPPGGRIERTWIGHVTDIMATCLELSGAAYPSEAAGRPIVPHAGRSLLPAVRRHAAAGPGGPRGEPDERTLFLEHEGNRAIKAGHWKAVSWYSQNRGWVSMDVGTGRRTGAWELYDLANDRAEETDLAREEPGRLKDLVSRYEEWAAGSRVTDWEAIQRRWGRVDDGDD